MVRASAEFEILARNPLGEKVYASPAFSDREVFVRGEKHVFYLQLQVNPTNVGHRSQDVRLYDGDELLATIDRSITVFP